MTRLLAFVFALMLCAPAKAAPAIDQAGADALKPRIAETLKGIEETLNAAGIGLRQDGAVMVEPAGTYYAVTTPNITLIMPTGITRTVGMLAINAIPTDNPDLFKVALALPTPMSDVDAEGTPVGTLTIGQQNLSGIWHMKAASFVELNAAYKDVLARNLVNGAQTHIPALALTMKLDEAAPNLWSGPIEAMATNLSRRDPLGAYAAASARMRIVLDKLDMSAPAAQKPAAQPADAAAAEGADSALRNMLLDFVTRYAEGIDNTVQLSDVRFTRTVEGQKPKSGTIKSATMHTTMSGLKSDAAGTLWDVAMDNVTIDDPALARFMPSQVNLRGKGQNIPLVSLLGGDAAMTEIFSKSGASFTVDSAMVEAPAFGLNGAGSFAADKDAAFGGAGNFKLAVRGLEDLMGWLSGPQGPASLGLPAIPPQLVAALSVVVLTGQPGTDAQGRATRSFDLAFSKDGQITLNGADISAMAQAIQQQSGAGAPAAVTKTR